MLKAKEDDMSRREMNLKKKHEVELQETADEYEDQIDELTNENNNFKNKNLYLETNSHEQKLEQERTKRLISSSFYYLGQI